MHEVFFAVKNLRQSHSQFNWSDELNFSATNYNRNQAPYV